MEAGKKRRIKRKVLKVAKLITEGLIRGAAAAAIGALIRYLIEMTEPEGWREPPLQSHYTRKTSPRQERP